MSAKVDLFQLPHGKSWSQLGSWVWIGEFEDYPAALERMAQIMAEDPKVQPYDFEVQGKPVLN